jgi:hypothetical protein
MKAKADLERPTFFAILYYTKDQKVRDIYNSHSFKTVPYIAASKMQVKRDLGENAYADFYKMENKWLIKKDEIYDTYKQLEFVNK